MFSKGGDARMYLLSLFSDPWKAPEEREIATDGVRMMIRRRTSDLFVIREVFNRKVYGEPPKGIVVDLGANIGAFSLYAARKAERVFAFEPESSNFAQLEKNIALNRALPIHIFKKAVGGKNGFAPLSKATVNKGASSLVFKRSDVQEQVETITLDHILSLCGLSHVDFLKIDIEGSEYELFESTSIHTLRRIGFIAMEVHRVAGKHVQEIITRLRDAGFEVRTKRTRLPPFGMKMLLAERSS